MALSDKFKALYNLPMREAVYILRNKIAPSPVPPLERILFNSKAMRSQKVFDFLNRYELVLERATGWERLRFEGAAVMEVGCGPLLGFLPLAVFCGARECVAVEPGFNPGVLQDARFEKRYFQNLWNDLVNLFGERMNFAAFMAGVRSVRVCDAGILDADFQGRFDVFLSNSCLEHVHPLEESLARLGACAAPGARCLHLVNYGNHAGTAYPFKGLYTREPEAWFKANGRELNLKRHPDVAKALAASGFEVQAHVMNTASGLAEEPAPWWRERYVEEDLLKRVVLYGGRAAD
ncbi:methyltransferase domain-containing protein [Desulfocurvus sp. DL9XJH121]